LPDLESPEEQVQLALEPLLLLDPLVFLDLVEEDPERLTALSPDPPSPLELDPVPSPAVPSNAAQGLTPVSQKAIPASQLHMLPSVQSMSPSQ